MDDFDPATAARVATGALRPLGTPERAAQEKRYLKSDLEFIGISRLPRGDGSAGSVSGTPA